MAEIDEIKYRYSAEVTELRKAMAAVAADFEVVDKAALRTGAQSESSLNMVQRGFTGLSERTRDAVRHIHQLNNASDASAKGLSAATSSTRNYGLAIQNTSFQVADFAVQVAAGTSATQALGQQLPQLLGGFGVLGAAIGAVVAVGGALIPVLLDTKDASEKMEDSLEGLNDFLSNSNVLLKEMKNGLTGVADEFARADLFQQKIIRSNLEESIRKGTQAISEQAAAIRALSDEQEIYITTIGGRDFNPSSQTGIARTVGGVSRGQAFELSEALKQFEQSDGSLEALKALADTIIQLRSEIDGASPEFTAFADSLLESIATASKSAEATEQLKMQLEELGKQIPDNIEAIKALNSEFEDSAAVALKLAEAARKIVADYSPMLAAKQEAYAKITALRDGWIQGAISAEDYAASVAKIRVEFEKASNPIGTVLESLREELRMLKMSGDERKRSEMIQEKLNAIREGGGQVTRQVTILVRREVDAILAQTKANKDSEQAERDSETAKKRLASEIDKLIDGFDKLNEKRKESQESLDRELERSKELYEAQIKGEDAVNALTDAYEAEDIAIKLGLGTKGLLVDKIKETVAETNNQKRATDELQEVQKRQKAEEEELLKARVEQAQDLLEEISDEAQDVFSNMASNIDGSFRDTLEKLRNRFIGWLGDLAYQALLKPIVVQASASVLGSITGQGGIYSRAAGAINSTNPLSSINPTSFLNGGGLYNNFALSGIGQSLGLSYGAGTLATNAGVFAAGSAALPTFAAGGPAALALTGPAGGYGAVAGLATASTGGAVGAATAGGSLAASGGLTGAGSALGAAVPFIGAGLAALAILGPMMFGGNPSVGPVGVADFAPGLGRGREFDQPLIDAFTADNGGNGEAMRPIAEAIAEIIADSADRFSATIDGSLRFRVANYQGPESGSGRMAGFEVNGFIRGEVEKRVAEGLTEQQAIFEALNFAVKEAFTFDSATMKEIAANTTATDTEELLGDLEFGRNFDMLTEALSDLGGEINANTLTQAQLVVAIQNQAEEFAKGALEPIQDSLRKALELFPANIDRETTRTEQVRGVYSNGNVEGGGGEFIEEGTDRFDAMVRGGAPVVTVDREVTETASGRAANFAANMERVSKSIEIAIGSVDQIIEQITGEFEPAVRGPFQQALEQGSANIRALAPELEDMNEQIRQAYLDFPGLENSLGTLGSVLVDVTATVDEALDALRDQLQEGFRDSIQAQMNEATGLGSINALDGIIEARDTNLSDAAALGIQYNTSGDNEVTRLFRRQVENLFANSSLGSIGQVISSGQIEDEDTQILLDEILVRKAEEAALESLIVLNNELIDKRKEEAAEAQRLIDQATENAEMLRRTVQSNIINPAVSPLNPGQQYEAALAQFRDAAALAVDDDPNDDESQDAIKRLPGLQDQLLKLALTNFGADERYYEVFEESQNTLMAIAAEHESIAEQQLSVLQSIDAAIAQLVSENESATGGFGTTYTQGSGGQYVSNTGFDLGYNPESALRILRTLAANNLETPTGFGEGQINAIRARNPAVHALLNAMGMNSGGLVPETAFSISGNDTVPIMGTPGEFMIREPAARRIGTAALAQINASGSLPSGNNSEVVSALYLVAGAVDRLSQQQAQEHREEVSVLSQVGNALTRSPYLAGGRR